VVCQTFAAEPQKNWRP